MNQHLVDLLQAWAASSSGLADEAHDLVDEYIDLLRAIHYQARHLTQCPAVDFLLRGVSIRLDEVSRFTRTGFVGARLSHLMLHIHENEFRGRGCDELSDRREGNPLPIDPAFKALGLDPSGLLHAQVFQNAACNWRCWYCFVPFNMLDASEERAAWVTAGERVDLYVAEEDRPPMIDLTGGQPELVPEWVPWTMRALRERGLEGKVFLWSDDNLSIDYFWSILSDADRDLVASFKGYGRVGCFKGFDAASFAFNTKAAPDLFDRQFELMRRYLETGIDLYAYTTFTAPTADGIEDAMKRFVDRLQNLHPNLPLRTVPLKIGTFGVVKKRLAVNDERYVAVEHQKRAIEAWKNELESRFSSAERAVSFAEVELRRSP